VSDVVSHQGQFTAVPICPGRLGHNLDDYESGHHTVSSSRFPGSVGLVIASSIKTVMSRTLSRSSARRCLDGVGEHGDTLGHATTNCPRPTGAPRRCGSRSAARRGGCRPSRSGLHRTAAERVGPVARHLDQLAAERPHDPPGRVEHAVVPGQIARVVVGDPVAQRADADLTALQQLSQQFGVVPDLVPRASRGYSLLRALSVCGSVVKISSNCAPCNASILCSRASRTAFLAGPAHVVARVVLRLVQQAEVHAGVVKILARTREFSCNRSSKLAKSPTNHSTSRAVCGRRDLEIQLAGPSRPHPGRLPEGLPWVARF